MELWCTSFETREMSSLLFTKLFQRNSIIFTTVPLVVPEPPQFGTLQGTLGPQQHTPCLNVQCFAWEQDVLGHHSDVPSKAGCQLHCTRRGVDKNTMW